MFMTTCKECNTVFYSNEGLEIHLIQDHEKGMMDNFAKDYLK